uniref:T cell receptor gamma chain n=1 Tax=Monodelphis domestica TaxID=13616 RepID=UPI001AA00D4C|nr:Chain B, T cell receptor gamma chain [Monodelphis domestica]7K0Z_D Chain D, T cell receptor gamma chain [Monodelphis domestica]
ETGSCAHMKQQVSFTGIQGDSARITCQVSNAVSYWIHWYRFQDGKPPQRLLCLSRESGELLFDEGFGSNKFHAFKDQFNGEKFILLIKKLEVRDSGMYYCAIWDWDGLVKVFGEGTRLIVTESAFKKKPPKPIFFLPTSEEIKQKQSGTYICLLEDFFPNVVKTYWKEDGNSQPLDAQFGPITGGGNSYSQVSWLTVKEDVLRKNLTYFYQHEDLGMEPKAFSISSVREKGSLVPR